MAENSERPYYKYHENVWEDSFIKSLSSPYLREEFMQKRDALVTNIRSTMKKQLLVIQDEHKGLRERLKLVDDIQNLGLYTFFEKEVGDALSYVYRCWNNDKGIELRRSSDKASLETTSLAFRYLRANGYQVSQDVLETFKSTNNSISILTGVEVEDEISQVKSVLELLRACGLSFRHESILDEAEIYSIKYLEKWLNNVSSKQDFINNKSLVMQVKYVLEFPYECSPPMFESRSYIDIYSANTSWLEEEVNCSILELSKLNFNILQAIYQEEVKIFWRWWFEENPEVAKFKFIRSRIVECCYFTVLALPQPHLSETRLTYAKGIWLAYIMDDTSDNFASTKEWALFVEGLERWNFSCMDKEGLPKELRQTFSVILDSLQEISSGASLKQGRDITHIVQKYWKEYAETYLRERIWNDKRELPTSQHYLETNVKNTGGSPVNMAVLVGLAPKLVDADFLEGFYRLHYLLDVITRLADDAQDFKETKEKGEAVTLIECYLNEHPGSCTNDALSHLKKLKKDYFREVNECYFKEDHLPPYCKFFCYDTIKSVCLFYHNVDGFSHSNTVIKEQIKKILFQAC